MEEITKYHEYLLAERTHVRNDKNILQWMRKCWKLATHASPVRMTATEYDELYATLLCEMTICWEDELGSAILEKMRQRDMSAFADLNFDRFCCSLFFFVEMWVEAVTTDEYERIFKHISRILSGDAPSMSLTNPTTLASFNTALDSSVDLDASNLSIGKSIGFDARRYYLQFGAAHIPPLPAAHVSSAPVRRRTFGSTAPSMPRSPCFPKRYHGHDHGDRLYKFNMASGSDDAFTDLQRRPRSGHASVTRDRSHLDTWHANRQRHAHITSPLELKCALSPATHRIAAFGAFTLKSHVQQQQHQQQQRPERTTRSAKYRLHADGSNNT